MVEEAISIVVRAVAHIHSQHSLKLHIRLLLSMPFTATAFAATLAPKVEIYTELACATHRPEILPAVFAFVGKANPCASDPVVQAAVAKLSACTLQSKRQLKELCLSSQFSHDSFHGSIDLSYFGLVGICEWIPIS